MYESPSFGGYEFGAGLRRASLAWMWSESLWHSPRQSLFMWELYRQRSSGARRFCRLYRSCWFWPHLAAGPRQNLQNLLDSFGIKLIIVTGYVRLNGRWAYCDLLKVCGSRRFLRVVPAHRCLRFLQIVGGLQYVVGNWGNTNNI